MKDYIDNQTSYVQSSFDKTKSSAINASYDSSQMRSNFGLNKSGITSRATSIESGISFVNSNKSNENQNLGIQSLKNENWFTSWMLRISSKNKYPNLNAN